MGLSKPVQVFNADKVVFIVSLIYLHTEASCVWCRLALLLHVFVSFVFFPTFVPQPFIFERRLLLWVQATPQKTDRNVQQNPKLVRRLRSLSHSCLLSNQNLPAEQQPLVNRIWSRLSFSFLPRLTFPLLFPFLLSRACSLLLSWPW